MEDLKNQTEITEEIKEEAQEVQDDNQAESAVVEDIKESDEVKEDVKVEEPKEEMISLTKSEFEQRLNNKFIEGQRKANKSGSDEYKAQLDQANARIKELEQELTAHKNILKMDELAIEKDKQEDLLAIIKGKGLELNEATISEEASKHPEWKKKAETSGISQLGQTKDISENERIRIENQKKKDRAAFGLK